MGKCGDDVGTVKMLEYPKANEIRWNLERDEALLVFVQDGNPIHCWVTLEALEEYARGATVEDGLAAAQEYLLVIENDLAVLVTRGRFEPDGTIRLRAADVQRMRS